MQKDPRIQLELLPTGKDGVSINKDNDYNSLKNINQDDIIKIHCGNCEMPTNQLVLKTGN